MHGLYFVSGMAHMWQWVITFLYRVYFFSSMTEEISWSSFALHSALFFNKLEFTNLWTKEITNLDYWNNSLDDGTVWFTFSLLTFIWHTGMRGGEGVVVKLGKSIQHKLVILLLTQQYFSSRYKTIFIDLETMQQIDWNLWMDLVPIWPEVIQSLLCQYIGDSTVYGTPVTCEWG